MKKFGSQNKGVINPQNLIGVLRQTDLNQSNDKSDVALFQVIDSLILLANQYKQEIDNSIKKDDIIAASQIGGILSPAHGGSISGVYTPTLSNTTNITASVATFLRYQIIGTTINVFGKVNVQTTGAGNTVLGISLPVLSYFLNTYECAGVGSCPTLANEVAAIFADTTNFRASMRWQTAGAATFDIFFTFSYQLVAKTA